MVPSAHGRRWGIGSDLEQLIDATASFARSLEAAWAVIGHAGAVAAPPDRCAGAGPVLVWDLLLAEVARREWSP